MNATDRIVQLVITVFLIVGVYQFYFWCQRHHARRPREFSLAIDDRIPFQPAWVWIYSFLYYPVIAYINLVVESPRHFLYVALSFMLLLGFQMLFFVLFPVATPEAWRAGLDGNAASIRFLKFVQSFDARSNSFPRMHTSVATLTAMHLLPYAGPWAFSFPVLIAASCLFTKQHYVFDLPAGAVLGWAVFGIFRMIY